MASEFLGLFTTPEQYQLAQQQAQEAQAIQYANLDPMARANYGTFRAGQQLGNAIGGALGGQDPQLQKIAQRQQILGMIDPSNPDSYAQAIQVALQGGDQEAAFLLRNEMMKVRQQAQEQQLSQLKTQDYLTERGMGMQAAGLTSRANELVGQLKNLDGTINEQVKAQLLSFPQGRAAISEQAKILPALRQLGAAGAVEDDPFKIFIDDATIPESVKISARQYSDSFKKGTIDPEKVDGIVTKLAESTQRVQQFEQNQQTIKNNQATLAEFRRQGLDNTAGFLAIAKSNNALAQQNAAFNRQEKLDKANAAAEKAKDGKPINFGDSTKLADKATGVDKLVGLYDTFKPEYAGYGTNALGEIAVFAAGKQSDEKSVALYQWWQNYQNNVNKVRNDLFGAALTAPEKAEFEKAMVTKGMDSAQAQANLRRQAEEASKAYDKLEKVLRVGGFSKAQLDALKPRPPLSSLELQKK
jgi:hypothetical protein